MLSSRSVRNIIRFVSERAKTILIAIMVLSIILLLSGVLFVLINRAPFMVGAGPRGASFIYPYSTTFQTSAEALALVIALTLAVIGYYALTEATSKVSDNRLANIIYVSGLVLFMLGIIIVLMIVNIKIGRIF